MNHSSYIVKNHSASPVAHYSVMRPRTTDTLVENLQALMSLRRISRSELARRSGVSERMLAFIFAGDRKPTIDTVEKLAKPLGVNGWQLILPGYAGHVAEKNHLDEVVDAYMHSSIDGKEVIHLIAVKESQRSKVK